jgi:glycerophosphoryl diester phosphodiesterase
MQRSTHAGLIATALAGLVVSCAAVSDEPSDSASDVVSSLEHWGGDAPAGPSNARLIARAVLAAATFAPGPTSGTLLGGAAVNGAAVPFTDKQPVQGFSAALDNHDGSFDVMCDNGFGSLENSADFNLRVYRIRPRFESRFGGPGTIAVERFFELRDPHHKVPFAITNHFTRARVLTGADFDIESMQRAADGTLWFGDEFGPFLLHTTADGEILSAPVPLPDFEKGGEVRSRQSPYNEESSAVRVMNAVRTHARLHGNRKTPVFSPWHVLVDDGNPATFVDHRAAPPAGAGLVPASSDIFDVKSIQSAGYPVVTWTVNETPRIVELMKLRVHGIISDRPDLLRQAVESFDANGDGIPGDWLDADGLNDRAAFDAQAHRGGRDLRPENTLPSMEAGLDNLVSTLETDSGITADGVPVLDHDPHVQAVKCRRADGRAYEAEVLVKDLTLAQLQSQFVCDKLLAGRTAQTNDMGLSPVAVAYAAERRLAHPYVMPSVAQLFDFVRFYAGYYRTGAGATHPDATRRWKNAERIRFNIETKTNPRAEFVARTIEPRAFASALARIIVAHGMQDRADVQSFDFRTLLWIQEKFPSIGTVYLFGDFPRFDDATIAGSDDGTNLQDEHGAPTPWLAGLFWPYRVTALDHPFRAQTSGGFEGMAIDRHGHRLLPLLEKPLAGADAKTLMIHEFDLRQERYTGARYAYGLEPRGTNIGDFILIDRDHGLVIERDGTQGDPAGFKAIYEIRLGAAGQPVKKALAVDLMHIDDPRAISAPGAAGDVGIGTAFSFPFTTIEDVVFFDARHIGVLNDNNYPFSVGRHKGTGAPDDEELIVLQLDHALGRL